MASKNLSVTVPEELYALLDERRKIGHYSRSEFVREALRHYLIPSVQATPEEIKAIEEGRKAFAAGDYATLDELERDLKNRA